MTEQLNSRSSHLPQLLSQVVLFERWLNHANLESSVEKDLRTIVNDMLVSALDADSDVVIFVDPKCELHANEAIMRNKIEPIELTEIDDLVLDSLLNEVPDMAQSEETYNQVDAWKKGVVDTSATDFEDLMNESDNHFDFLVDEVEIDPEKHVENEDELEDKDTIQEILDNQSYQEVNEVSHTEDDDLVVGEHDEEHLRKEYMYENLLQNDISSNEIVDDMLDVDSGLDGEAVANHSIEDNDSLDSTEPLEDTFSDDALDEDMFENFEEEYI